MARIPATDIPNAPQGAGPVLRQRMGRVRGVDPVDVSGAALDRSGLDRAQGILSDASGSIQRSSRNVAAATAGGKQDLLDVRDFTAGGRALEFAGGALAKAGDVAMNFANDMMIAKDTMDLSRVDGILRDARDQHKLFITENQVNPASWVPKWNEKMPDVQTRIESLGLSGRIRQRVTEDVARFWTQQTTDFAISASGASIAAAKSEAEASVSRAFFDGDWEIADQLIEENANVGIFTPEKAQALREEQVSRKRDEWVNTALSADPKSVMEEMQASRESGKSEAFPWMTPAEILKVESVAKSQFRQQQSDASDKLDDSIIVGEFSTPEQIRQYAEENDLPETLIASAMQALTLTIAQSPKAQAEYKAHRSALLSEVTSYDPETDPEQEKYWEIKDRLRTQLEEGDRKEALDELYARRKDGMTPSAQLKSSLYGTIDNLQKQGLLGDSTYDADKKKVKDWNAYMQVEQKGVELKQWVDGVMRENPQITPEEARQKFQQKIGGDAASAASKAFTDPTRARNKGADWIPALMLPGFRKPSAPTSEQIQKLKGTDMGILKKGQTMQDKQKEIAAQAPDFRDPEDSKKIPASIRYNNPGAQYPGPSSKKFGAVATKIIGGGHKIAVFPDAISGAAAHIDLLERVYSGKTLRQIITKWSGGNSADLYVKTIARDTGIKPDQVVTREMLADPKIGVVFAKEMAEHESGKPYPLTDAQWTAAHRKAFSV